MCEKTHFRALEESADWHLFICTKIRISKNREKRRKTKKTRENLGVFGWHLFCQDVLRCVDKKMPTLSTPKTRCHKYCPRNYRIWRNFHQENAFQSE